ncbi:MAG: hypothetical protein KKB50_04020 [Planctomycetes bacterium]|nr:hypothetical protein [Planctomycetota bacterium]
MRRRFTVVFALGLCLLVAGCAETAFVTHGVTRTGKFFGEVGVTGDNNHLTIESESKILKLSFIGSGNTVMIEEDVTIGKVEFWGSNNTVSVPAGAILRSTEVGRNNKITYRPSIWSESEGEFQSPQPGTSIERPQSTEP